MPLQEPLRALYKEVDGSKIHCDIYTPSSQYSKGSKLPVLINIHGGAFCLGHSGEVNKDLIGENLERGWIVAVPDHRLCPQVDIASGPLQDCRDFLSWIQNGDLEEALRGSKASEDLEVDYDRIAAMGTSSGGCIALGLGFGVSKPVAAIVDFYGAINFTDPFWTKPLPTEKAQDVPGSYKQQIFDERPVPTKGGVSLEGHQNEQGPPKLTPRAAWTFTAIAKGTLIPSIIPDNDFAKVDPVLNISEAFPPTCILHGTADTKVPHFLSIALQEKLRAAGVKHEFIDVPDAEHTFVGRMKPDTEYWKLSVKAFDWLDDVLH